MDVRCRHADRYHRLQDSRAERLTSGNLSEVGTVEAEDRGSGNYRFDWDVLCALLRESGALFFASLSVPVLMDQLGPSCLRNEALCPLVLEDTLY